MSTGKCRAVTWALRVPQADQGRCSPPFSPVLTGPKFLNHLIIAAKITVLIAFVSVDPAHARCILKINGTRMRAGLCATVAFSVIGLVDCGSVSNPSLPSLASPAPISAVAYAAPQVSPSVCTPPSLAHCYTEATLQSYIDRVIPMIAQFFRAKYRAMPEPPHYYFIAEGQRAQSSCQDEEGGYLDDANTYAYCRVDQNIYLGQAMMWHLYNEDGDAAPAVGLAHEWGHHVQSQVGVPAPTTNAESVNHENQADCVAGAWIQYADQQKWLEQEDVGSIARLVADIASAEGTSRTHGDLEERSDSLVLGLKGGLEACNSFYPANPIITTS
jgi:hypothetical protein